MLFFFSLLNCIKLTEFSAAFSDKGPEIDMEINLCMSLWLLSCFLWVPLPN